MNPFSINERLTLFLILLFLKKRNFRKTNQSYLNTTRNANTQPSVTSLTPLRKDHTPSRKGEEREEEECLSSSDIEDKKIIEKLQVGVANGRGQFLKVWLVDL